MEKGKRRVLELNGIFKKLYEDRVSGRLTDERFDMLSQDYENEQHILIARMEQLEQEIECHTEKAQDTKISCANPKEVGTSLCRPS